MSYNARLRNSDFATAATTVTGTAGQTVEGTAVPLDHVAEGVAVACRFSYGVTTSSLQFTPYLQVSDDASTWYTYKTGSACTAGNGTLASSNATLAEVHPPYKYIRGYVVSSGATAVSGDTVAMSWNYLRGTAA